MLSIAFISDSGYVLPSVVAITSLLMNKKDSTEYKIYFMAIGLSEDEKKQISNICKKYNTEILIIDVNQNELRNRYSGIGEHECCANISALIKFDLPTYCPEDKLLYLDGDLIVQKDISELEGVNFDEKTFVAAVPESGLLYNKNIIIQGVRDYFNSGVMLLNLKGFRENDISRKLYLEKINSNDNSLMDQHVFNKVFAESKVRLDHSFNVLYTSIVRAHFFHGISIDQINDLYGKKYSGFEQIKENAKIIHYSTFDKPWKFSDIEAVELWDYYFENSVFKGNPLKRKRIHNKFLNGLRKRKAFGLLGTFIWETETKGIKKAVLDVKKYIIRAGKGE